MESLTFAQVQEFLRCEDLSQCDPLKISVLRNVMVEPIEPYLRYFAYQLGCNAKVAFGAYDNVFQEAVGESRELLNDSTDCVLVFVRLETLSWSLARNFSGLDAVSIRQESDRIDNFVMSVLSGIRSQTSAMILWCGFEDPLYPAEGVSAFTRSGSQVATIRNLNERLRGRLEACSDSYLIDLNICRMRLGGNAFHDARYWHVGRAPYSREALREIAGEALKLIRAARGQNRKCLILDCDNVLWGGVIGEDGLSGIKLGTDYPGSPYYELQQEALNLYQRGVILALCSKNNANDVWDVFRNHPNMLLREEHIAAARINWQEKSTNIKEIAGELNIGLESLVFLDDSEFEINLVRGVLPQVQVLHLPKQASVKYRDLLAAGGWFDGFAVTEEDRRRGALYRSESGRRRLRETSIDLETYYQSLAMSLEIRFVDTQAIPRIGQLTRKTNQFNLTARRYSDEQIAQFTQDLDRDVISLRLVDRFGDAGIVGVGILAYKEDTAVVDTFLLSCRIIGRRVEDVLLSECVKRAQSRSCTLLRGEYRPTDKNTQVRDFYPRHGFREAASVDGVQRFEMHIGSTAIITPACFHQIISEIAPSREEQETGDHAL